MTFTNHGGHSAKADNESSCIISAIAKHGDLLVVSGASLPQ